ncbi:class I SAM-dependent methyltransferase [Caldalkalibacillus mannanilyticus]|uniref:class I SAM-dependent methyltransferase n=1 Tax=Caldalkalibacillus mannanilyticus TaxID=1418 RepID=UPI00046A6731|nr:methylase [Caldalkalibacillus mannanilyticus]
MREKYEQKGVAMTCRSYQEYLDMFMLDEEVMARGPVLDVASGASSFVQEMNKKGYKATAVDPMYQEDASFLQRRGLDEIEESTKKLADVQHLFQWAYYGSLENHYNNRKDSLAKFIADYQGNSVEPRYKYGTLPNLPFGDETFSLILCSHFLFLYGEQFDYSFHLKAVQELLRICAPGGEIRIYPIVGFDGEDNPQINRLIQELQSEGVRVSLAPTTFRFLKGATRYLHINKA